MKNKCKQTVALMFAIILALAIPSQALAAYEYTGIAGDNYTSHNFVITETNYNKIMVCVTPLDSANTGGTCDVYLYSNTDGRLIWEAKNWPTNGSAGEQFLIISNPPAGSYRFVVESSFYVAYSFRLYHK